MLRKGRAGECGNAHLRPGQRCLPCSDLTVLRVLGMLGGSTFRHWELSLVCQGLPLSTRKSFVDWLPTILPPAPDSRFQIRKPGEVQSFAQVTLRCRPRIHTQAVWLQNLFVTTVLCRLPWQCPSVNAICFQHWHQEYCWICTRSAADGWPGR